MRDWWKQERVRRVARWSLWGIAGSAVAGVAFGWLWLDVGDRGRLVGLLNWCAFVFRTFSLFIGIGLMVVAVGVALLKAYMPAAVMMACAIACVIPTVRMYGPAEQVAMDAAAALTVMSVNAMYGDADEALLLAEVDRVKPDVLVIQEYTWEMDQATGWELLQRLPHRKVGPETGAFGMALYSRLAFVGEPELMPEFPARGVDGELTSQRPDHPQIRAVVSVGGREVVVQGVHTYPPLHPGYLRGQRQLTRGLAEWAEKETRPVVMAGDFNFTVQAREAGWLRRAGLVNTQTKWGRGKGTTWPDQKAGSLRSLLPKVRIDHVWVKGLVGEAPEVGKSIGTDHRPVVSRVGFEK